MVQIDVALSASVGATLAVAARRSLLAEPRLLAHPRFAWALVFQAAVVVPAVLYFLAGWPAWDTMYWFDPGELPAWLAPAVALTCLSAAAVGFGATHAVLRRGGERAALLLPALFGAPAVAVLVVFHDRFLHVGDKGSFAAGAPANLLSSDLAWALGLVIPLWVGVPLGVVALRWARGPA